ncbi:MAG TPA: undecaprenyl-diphosphatase UppP [Opitutales bacterium]|nr:undecaprenyl-diphosphatase UppP [Opitutales bacterium]
MTYIEAIIFGIVQGLTEFLPISSTAHLAITGYLFGYAFPGLSFEIFLHQASVLAVILYFRKELIELVVGFFRFLQTRRPEDRRHFYFGIYIVVATFITGGLGYLLHEGIKDHLKTPGVMAGSLFLTGFFLIFIERFKKYGNLTEETMKLRHAVIVGLVQTMAVIPGISRSGSTLVAALWCGLNRETAVRFSFLLAIPVILGSSVMTIPSLNGGEFAEIGGAGQMSVAFLATFIFSIIGIIWLIEFLKKSRLIYFAIYCFLLAAFVWFRLDPTVIAGM